MMKTKKKSQQKAAQRLGYKKMEISVAAKLTINSVTNHFTASEQIKEVEDDGDSVKLSSSESQRNCRRKKP
jgi:hypothetical protein